MADRFNSIVVTCPPNTQANAPLEVPLNFPGGILREFEIVIPFGHAGLTAIGLGFGHGQLIPEPPASGFSGDDRVVRRVVNDRWQGVPWSAFLVNLDLGISHQWEIEFAYDEMGSNVGLAQPSFISPADILAAGGINSGA